MLHNRERTILRVGYQALGTRPPVVGHDNGNRQCQQEQQQVLAIATVIRLNNDNNNNNNKTTTQPPTTTMTRAAGVSHRSGRQAPAVTTPPGVGQHSNRHIAPAGEWASMPWRGQACSPGAGKHALEQASMQSCFAISRLLKARLSSRLISQHVKWIYVFAPVGAVRPPSHPQPH